MYSTPGIVACTTAYQYLSCPGTEFTQFLVTSQPVAVGFGVAHGSYGPEACTYDVFDQILLPGSNPIPQLCDAIRFKNATPGVVGNVQISARRQRELPQGVTLQSSYVPASYVLNPDGTVTATFSGHVIALGLDFPPSPSDTIVSGDNRVNWITPGGTVYDGLIYVSNTGGSANVDLQNRRMQLGTFPFKPPSPIVGTPTSGIDIIDWPSGGSAQNVVFAFTRGGGITVIDSTFKSSFPQFFVPDNIKIQYGVFTRAVGAGASSQAQNLTFGYTSTILALCWVQIAAGASTSIYRSYFNSGSQIGVDLNSSIAQNVTFGYMTFGA